MLAATVVTDPVPALVVATFLLASAALLLAGLAAARSRPRRPTPGPATMELGPEPPAVVNLLCDGFEVSSLAAPATVVDLAARGWCVIEELGPGAIVVRLRAHGGDGDLRPHEARVLEHLRGLAVDGVVPTAALTTGPEAASRRWWRGFRREVIAEAAAAGWCRPRWTLGVRLGVLVLALAAGAAGAGAALLGEQTVVPVGEPAPAPAWWWWGSLGAVGLAIWLAGRILRSDRQRDTDAGRERASRWLGVRSHLADHGDFARQPAAAVAVWDRYLAHAVALDLAPLATGQLPLGAESDRHAWSRESGQWRHVRVRYPRMRPGWGRHPLAVTASSLLQGGLAAVLGYAAVLMLTDRVDLDEVPERVLAPLDAAAAAVLVLAGLGLAWATVSVVRAVPDLVSRREVEGVVLRRRARRVGDRLPGPLQWLLFEQRDRHTGVRGDQRRTRHYLAVDTGDGDAVLAWSVDPTVYRSTHQGARIRARVTPRLGHVRDVEVLGGSSDHADRGEATVPPAVAEWMGVAVAGLEQLVDRAAAASGGLSPDDADRARRQLDEARQRLGAVAADDPTGGDADSLASPPPA